ncbi:hypothetical protein [Archangium sp.]|uniref:hypothetical protein n=1 Tax=Archangium sp. TaxID=1872627 RepID=UPI00286A249C|nr:hypothetical protein [Archangium sp.]
MARRPNVSAKLANAGVHLIRARDELRDVVNGAPPDKAETGRTAHKLRLDIDELLSRLGDIRKAHQEASS